MCYNYKILVSVILLILLFQTSVKTEEQMVPRIINGYPCDTSKVPYFVIIRHKFSGGGALITYSWVLTVAHVLNSNHFGDGFDGTVYTRYDMPEEMRQIRAVKSVHRHPKFDEELVKKQIDVTNDIGLVSVVEPFEQNAFTKLATLPAPGFTKHCNRVMVAGTGDTVKGEIWAPDKPVEKRPLKCVNTSIVDINVCRKKYSSVINFDTTLLICTYGPQGNEGPCPGDSGAPLICDNVVIGAVSSNAGCDPRVAPDFYPMVEKYLDFIDQHVKFTDINIKHAPINGTGVDGQKPSDKSPANSNNKHVHTNDSSVSGKKAPDKSLANIVQGPNWKLLLLTLLYSFLLYC